MPTINCRGHEGGCRESKHLCNYQRDIQDMIYAKEQGQNPTLRPSLLNYTCKADSGCADGGLGQNKQTNKQTNAEICGRRESERWSRYYLSEGIARGKNSTWRPSPLNKILKIDTTSVEGGWEETWEFCVRRKYSKCLDYGGSKRSCDSVKEGQVMDR